MLARRMTSREKKEKREEKEEEEMEEEEMEEEEMEEERAKEKTLLSKTTFLPKAFRSSPSLDLRRPLRRLQRQILVRRRPHQTLDIVVPHRQL